MYTTYELCFFLVKLYKYYLEAANYQISNCCAVQNANNLIVYCNSSSSKFTFDLKRKCFALLLHDEIHTNDAISPEQFHAHLTTWPHMIWPIVMQIRTDAKAIFFNIVEKKNPSLLILSLPSSALIPNIYSNRWTPHVPPLL